MRIRKANPSIPASGRLLLALLCLPLVACERFQQAPEIPFMAFASDYASKPFFARVEHTHPLTESVEGRRQLSRVTPRYLAGLEQEKVDQIYARLSAGPIPEGAFDGDLFFPEGSSGKLRASEVVSGLKSLAVRLKGKKLEILGSVLWKGKVFYRDERVLRNRIEDLAILAPVIDDMLSVPKIDVDGRDSWLLFPARLYCGQSLLDGRRESIIIDYAFTDEIPGYREKPDYLAGRRGFQVRDEIRMVRPGFYLGRAYLARAFVLNFTLYNEEIAERALDDWIETGRVPEDCWVGNQRLAARASG
jgi:hypothetical protein